jgi:hypothetical protein
MSFNKNTWSKDYTGAKGIKLLGADDARRKGFSPKYARKGAKASSEVGSQGKGGKGAARQA